MAARAKPTTAAPLCRVLADDRERHGGVVDALRAYEDVEVGTTRLATGDYIADGRTVFERKTLADLAASVADGRLFRQAKRLANLPQQAVCILEGTGPRHPGMSREGMQGGLIALSVVFGIPLLRSAGPEETAWLIRRTAHQVRKVAAGAHLRAGIRPKGRRKLQLHLLQGLPRVGPDLAERLLDAFGSVEGVMEADVEELLLVEGIGRRTASRIRWAVSEGRGRYG
jgi:ERCC4-type nuclease